MNHRSHSREMSMSHPSAIRTIRHRVHSGPDAGRVIYISPAQAANFQRGASRFETHHYPHHRRRRLY